MADSSPEPGSSATDPQLIEALAAAFEHGALPGENEGFDAAACREAAEFAMTALARREGQRPGIAIETIGKVGDSARRLMRIAIVNDNMPFLVDSVAITIAGFGLAVERVIHPVIAVRRDGGGHLTDIITGDASGERRESVIYLEMQRADAKQRRAIERQLFAVLDDVRAAVEDWQALQATMRHDAEQMQDGEGAALLRWFLDNNLTLLAHVEHDRDGNNSKELGVARIGDKALLADESYQLAFDWFDNGGRSPLVIKSNLISTVHRRVPLDLVILPVYRDGGLAALSVHGAIWTSAALAAFPQKVPVLRAHLELLMQRFGFDKSGHAGKALAHALTALPHDVLLGFDLNELERVALTAMSLADRPRPKLVTIRSSLGRHLFAFAWLPRDEVSTGRRLAIEELIVRASNAKVLNWSINLGDGEVALIRYVLDMRGAESAPDDEVLDRQFQLMVRGWVPAVEEELSALGEESRAAALTRRYADAFPASYQMTYGAAEAARDIVRLRLLDKPAQRNARLYCLPGDGENRLRLKLIRLDGNINLSEAVPVLENFGFDVVEQVPTPLDGGALGTIHDFLLEVRDAHKAEQIIERAEVIETAIARTLEHKAENDLFNSLIVTIGLSQRETIWLRAWFRYLRQTGLSYGMETVVEALHDAPEITHALTGLFAARHDPEFTGERDAATDAHRATIRDALTRVSAIDDDRLLRLFQGLVMAVLRTNAFAPASREALAFKLDSAKVPGLPAPLPWREVFVYSPRVEGIHLRAGPVARGGLRWSDRRDDFRTEILGLMKAQRVKNAVIVPTGAKGGFFPKQLPNPQEDRDAWLAEGTESYRIFIRTLLSITDNIVEGSVVHPDQVVVHDGDDPYFVVAADKGTATFSDIANAIAAERGFWLGDAFASGGSNGYDHKAMGITAKGAWVSVQRHFAEMGVDVQSDPVRVAGCGDMSGDVFGNGMLLSRSIKLVGAFDHRHIFIDPDPDPAKSWAERQRMFDLPRSSWEDYDASLISKGGGVFSRKLKTIPLSDEMRALLGTDAAEMEPNAIISALLTAEIDLLWFGGIGTYIKAPSENNIDVGDPANDALRANADRVRARVIGEGANLGVTQAGRIAFALHGGRINTDFIDNSAGVDCSDNEVNIKIGLTAAMREGALDEADRNALLVAMTDSVSDIVLEDNRLQALGLSIAESGGTGALPSYIRLIEMFEEQGRLDRAVEGLAPNDELQRRTQDDKGLARPELAVLLSTAKLAMQDAIENSALIADPTMQSELLAAFPPPMRERFAGPLAGHQLRGPIIATKLANRIVNRMGLLHPFELVEEEGATLGHVAIAFVTAERLFDMAPLWAELDRADMAETTRLLLFERAAHGLRSQMADIVRISSDRSEPGQLLAALSERVGALSDQVDALLTGEARSQTDRLVRELVAAGASEKHAELVARLFKLDGAIGLAELSNKAGIEPALLTNAFSLLGEKLGLDWTQMTAARMQPSDPWERLLVAGLSRDFQQMRLEFLAASGSADPIGYVESWAGANAQRIRQFRSLVGRAQLAVSPSIPMLAQIASQARTLLRD